MNNETIFHYTNLHAFKSIIETGELWFTRIDCLNDYSEFSYYNKVLSKARDDFISEHNVHYDYDLLIINKWVDDNLVKPRDAHCKKTFISSFSSQGDSIPMWNYYSDKSGIAIGFNRDLLVQELIKNVGDFYLLSPCYIKYNKEMPLKDIKSRLDEILKIAHPPEPIRDNDDIRKIFAKFPLGAMWYESNMFKDESFTYEWEFRIALCKLFNKKANVELDKIHWVVTKNNIKPVMKIKVTENWNNILTNIIVSPLNQSDQIIENMHDFLLGNQINIDKNMIIKSKCPLRDF